MRGEKIFLSLQGVLYMILIYIDLFVENYMLGSIIKFAVISFCMIYVFIASGNRLLQAAMFFTAIADLIILFMEPKYYLYGLISFIIVQQLHGERIRLNAGMADASINKGHWNSPFFRITVQLLISLGALIILLSMNITVDSLLMVSAFYFISLLHNVIYGAVNAVLTKKKEHIIFAAGLLLFLLCDINVGIFNIGSYVVIETAVWEKIYQASTILMWVFYAPSQVLIAWSGAVDK